MLEFVIEITLIYKKEVKKTFSGRFSFKAKAKISAVLFVLKIKIEGLVIDKIEILKICFGKE